jgi:glycosyltransferase involved in cell wall biosynthesis
MALSADKAKQLSPIALSADKALSFAQSGIVLESATFATPLVESSKTPTIRVLGIATQGAGGNDEARLRTLLRNFDAEILPFDRAFKRQMTVDIVRKIRTRQFRIAVMEGTGLSGGLALMIGRLTEGVPYVVSSGDAVAPFLSRLLPWSHPFAGIYERALYRLSDGFIGWTPYLVGRALTFGARRAITIPGWASFQRTPEQVDSARREVRSRLGIPQDAVVFGIAGSLVWNENLQYSYGLEMVRAMSLVTRPEIRVLIVGDGTGAPRLRELAGERLGKTIIMTGNVPRSAVPDYLAAMDIGSLPQSVDAVGSFRYTTKLPEYLSLSLPIVTGQTPLSYDFIDDWLWRLPGDAPWADVYIRSLAELMKTVTLEQIGKKRNNVGRLSHLFDENEQVIRATCFIKELCAVTADGAQA